MIKTGTGLDIPNHEAEISRVFRNFFLRLLAELHHSSDVTSSSFPRSRVGTSAKWQVEFSAECRIIATLIQTILVPEWRELAVWISVWPLRNRVSSVGLRS